MYINEGKYVVLTALKKKFVSRVPALTGTVGFAISGHPATTATTVHSGPDGGYNLGTVKRCYVIIVVRARAMLARPRYIALGEIRVYSFGRSINDNIIQHTRTKYNTYRFGVSNWNNPEKTFRNVHLVNAITPLLHCSY